MLRSFLERFMGTSQNHEKAKKLQNQRALLLYARELDITSGDIDKYWKWFSLREKSESFDVAELVEVTCFEVRGSFDTESLAPNTKYEVLLLFKFTIGAYGWIEPVKMELILPSGERKVDGKIFYEIPQIGDKWLEMKIGEFWTTHPGLGKVEFSLTNRTRYWKKGIIVKGVLVRPAADQNN